MAYNEEMSRDYMKRRFPHASAEEREKVVRDWVTKEGTAASIAEDFERRIRPLNGLRVLDVGSGNGGIGIALANRGAFVEGVDIEEELVNIARAEALSLGSSAHFTCYDGNKLPFEDHSFDAAISVSVLEHVADPVRYLSEIFRVLKPNGSFYLAFPNRLNPKETHTGLWGLSYLPRPLARLYIRLMRRSPLEDNGLHFYSYWQVRRLLRKASSNGYAWRMLEERGKSTNPLKRFIKGVLRVLGIPHQAFLSHVMVVLKKNYITSTSDRF